MRWAVLVSKLQKGKDRWSLVRLPQEGYLAHERIDEKMVKLPVHDYMVDEEGYWSFLVDDHINKAVEI